MLIDVSRLVWRMWTRRLPTGIDRVCLAYLDHYGERCAGGGAARRTPPHPFGSAVAAAVCPAPRAAARAFGAGSSGSWPPRLPTASARQRATRGRSISMSGTPGSTSRRCRRGSRDNGCAPIYLVHDLIPLTHPQYCRAGEAAKHERRMISMLASAHGIIGNSQATLDELAAFASARRPAMPPRSRHGSAGRRRARRRRRRRSTRPIS